MHDAGEPADGEQGHEPGGEMKGDRRAQRAVPHGGQPVENLHAGRDRDQHARDRERGVGHRTHTGREHVVAPHAEAEEADEDAGVDHDRRAEQRLA